jgi:putative ABC transport system permease protein
METLFKDLRYGIRSLLKQPAFSLVAIGTLALAIGGNSAMFTVVNAVLLRPLPYPEPDRIVTLKGSIPPEESPIQHVDSDFADWQNQNQVFEQMAGFVTGGLVLNNGDEAERVRGAWVTGDFFTLLRTTPLRGRTLQARTQPGKEPLASLAMGCGSDGSG